MSDQLDILACRITEGLRWMPEGFQWGNLNLAERMILSFLYFHQGRAMAICCESLAESVCQDKRKVRIHIKKMIEDHGLAIGSALKKPMGYFLIQTEGELRDYCRQLKHRSLSGLVRCAKLEKRRPEYLGQIRLELG